MSLVILSRIRFSLGSGAHIEIEVSDDIKEERPVRLNAPGFVSGDEIVKETAGGEAPKMCWREDGGLFEPFQLREDTDYFIDLTLPLSLSQAISQSLKHSAWPLSHRLASFFVRDPHKRWRETEIDGSVFTIVTGRLRLNSFVGVIDLGVECAGALRAEVASRKLKYFEEFKALLDSLAEKSAELLMAFESPVSFSFSVSEELAKNDAALQFSLRYLMLPGQLPSAIDEIVSSPCSFLLENTETRLIHDIDEVDADVIVDNLEVSLMGSGGPLSRFFGGYTPRELYQNHAKESFDTIENRFAKAFLEHCVVLSQKITSRMLSRKKWAAASEAASWSARLNEMLQHDFWKQIGPLGEIPSNSQVMLRKPGYKELFRLDVALRMSLDLVWPHGAEFFEGLSGDARPVSQLYEYWCFFSLREVLQSLCTETGGGDFLTVSEDGLQVRLVKGARSECRFVYESSAGIKLNVSLYYNKRFSRPKKSSNDWYGSYTASFDPDYSVLVKDPKGVCHWLHFDAKYRLEKWHVEHMFDAELDDYSSRLAGRGYEKEISRFHKQDDLFKMHTYRDGILSTRGAYVLFPGDGVGGRWKDPRKNLFVRHPSSFSEKPENFIPSVGAFPLAPDGSGRQADAIRELLSLTLEGVSNSTNYVEENGWFSG